MYSVYTQFNFSDFSSEDNFYTNSFSGISFIFSTEQQQSSLVSNIQMGYKLPQISLGPRKSFDIPLPG